MRMKRQKNIEMTIGQRVGNIESIFNNMFSKFNDIFMYFYQPNYLSKTWRPSSTDEY